MKKLLLIALMAIAILMVAGCQNTHITSARLYINQNNYDQAIDMCKIAIEQNPSDPDAWYEMGRAYGLKGDYLEMKHAFDKSLEAGPKNEQNINYVLSKHYSELFNLGALNSQNGEHDKAIEKFTTATLIEPKRHEAYLNLAYAYSQVSNDSMIIDTYQRAMTNMPDSTQFAYNLAISYYSAGKYEEAIPVFQQLIDKEPEGSQMYFDATFNMANSHAMLEQDDKAMEIYEKALIQDPENTAILYNMGRTHLLKNEYKKAIGTFKKVVEIDAGDFQANYAIGSAYIAYNKTLIDKYNDSLDKTSEDKLKIMKDEIDANFKTAKTHLENAVEIEPENSGAWYSLGIVYTRLGEMKKAEDSFDQSEALQAQGK